LALRGHFIIFRYKENKLNILKTKDMANMSYCRFENTFHDLQDCSINLSSDLSESELEYKEKLIELCKEIIEHDALLKGEFGVEYIDIER
jgi:hypothetical protein